MNKNIIKIAASLIVLVVLVFLMKDISLTPTENKTEEKTDQGVEKIKIDPNVPIDLPLSNASKDVAWGIFQKYLGYNKARDLEGIKSVVYKIAPVCEDPKTRIDCEARMNLAYQYGSVMQKEYFVNVWEDEKQLILSTDFRTEKNQDTLSRVRSIIFFVKDTSGNFKMLSFSPFKGAKTNKGAASQEEVDARLIIYTEDKDNDGIAGYEEECIGALEDTSCVKTDPKIRDTDGNGFWDGVEALMK